MEKAIEIAQANPIVLIIPALIFILLGFRIIWDKLVRQIRINNGHATATFNNIFGRTLSFIFKEDAQPIEGKTPEGKPNGKLKFGKLGKIIVWRNLYLLGFILTIALGYFKNSASAWVLTATILLIFTRASKIFAERHQKLQRMFEVASVNLNYARDADLNPWSWIRITAWQDLTTVSGIVINYPAKFKSGDPKLRKKFEDHFNETITSQNTWIYEWKGDQSNVTVTPVPSIPTYAQYKGSSHSEWNKIPLGLVAGGEAVWDVSVSPHSLVTGTTGGGKSLSLDELVMTKQGMKKVGDIQVGDTLFDPDGNQTKVTHLHPIITPSKAYEITFSNGEKVVADPDHLWETETREARLSRFNNANKSVNRQRSYWISEEIENKLKNEYEKTANSETISIPDMAKFVGKNPANKIFHNIAKEIGVAEEITPIITVHDKGQIITQKQVLKYVDSQEFIEVYNNRKPFKATSSTPLSLNQRDKIRQLSSEIRATDILTVESIIEYLGTNKHVESWVRRNFDESKDNHEAIRELYKLSETASGKYPDKIFSIDKEWINSNDFASLLGLENTNSVKSLFLRLAKLCVKVEMRKEPVKLVRSERTSQQRGTPYFVYPKKLFIDRLIKRNATPINDQRHKMLTPAIRTTQEIFDTLHTTGATIYTNHSVKKTKALVMDERELPMNPYDFATKEIIENIPQEYLFSSISQRQELLRGLLDTHGKIKRNGSIEIHATNKRLKDDFKVLISSLGYIPFVKNNSLSIAFQANPEDELFGIKEKNQEHTKKYKIGGTHSSADLHYIKKIRVIEPMPMRCLSVDSPSRLFLVSNSMIPTHNSTIQRNIVFHCIQHPEHWRFLGIDVKRVELSAYRPYEPVVMGIATTVQDGVEFIRYAKEQMMERYTEMEEKGVTHFLDLPTKMHALLVMVDETYMFLAQSGIKTDEGKEEDQLKGEASKMIGDIARLGRAAGVHLLLATQRPDATVIYGELKQNLSCRIAAGRADSIASQMTLDNDEATMLPAIKGRGYVQNFGEGEQFQGYFAPQKWIDKWTAKDSDWLNVWAKKGIDLDKDPNALDNEILTKKKVKKPKSITLKKDQEPTNRKKEKKSKLKEEKSINLEKDGSLPKKKKMSWMEKAKQFNESQMNESNDLANDNTIHLAKEDHLMKDADSTPEVEDLISPENSEFSLSAIGREIGDNPFEGLEPEGDLSNEPPALVFEEDILFDGLSLDENNSKDELTGLSQSFSFEIENEEDLLKDFDFGALEEIDFASTDEKNSNTPEMKSAEQAKDVQITQNSKPKETRNENTQLPTSRSSIAKNSQNAPKVKTSLPESPARPYKASSLPERPTLPKVPNRPTQSNTAPMSKGNTSKGSKSLPPRPKMK